jgi:hypothetical protein
VVIGPGLDGERRQARGRRNDLRFLAADDSVQGGRSNVRCRHGALVWEDLDSGSFVQDVAAESELVFVAGSGTDASGSASATIRAYDVETGVVAWIDHVPAGADGIVSYSRLTVEDNDLFAGGSIFGRFANTTYVRALSLRPALSR